jgi:hypothetical protein
VLGGDAAGFGRSALVDLKHHGNAGKERLFEQSEMAIHLVNLSCSASPSRRSRFVCPIYASSSASLPRSRAFMLLRQAKAVVYVSRIGSARTSTTLTKGKGSPTENAQILWCARPRPAAIERVLSTEYPTAPADIDPPAHSAESSSPPCSLRAPESGQPPPPPCPW